jgi:aminoglycoside phosphotransferase (APT) family kinase protein
VSTETERTSDLIDPVRLGAWMDAEGIPGKGLPLEHSFISGGSQNEIFAIRRGDFQCALRRPPKEAPPGREEGIVREYRIIEALDGTDVPHTEAVGLCTDHSVLGSSFYLMGLIDGWSPVGVETWPAPFDSDEEARRGMAFQLVDGIARLAKVDWRAKGLSDLGRPEGYHDRQVERWIRFLDRVKTRELPGLDVATAWLSTHRPIDFVPGIMHGDYQFANVMYHYGMPVRLAAIIDWEMGTIGDPKIDLAWVVQQWPTEEGGTVDMGYGDLSGMPARQELVDYYATESGRQVDDIDYYVILAKWKLAIVLEQGYMRATQNPGLNEKQLAFGPLVLDLMASAAEVAESTDYAVTETRESS